MKSNYERYKELKSMYKISRMKVENPDDYDIIITGAGRGYASTSYEVVKNGPNLSKEDLAIICDDGNLCFGYEASGNVITVYID